MYCTSVSGMWHIDWVLAKAHMCDSGYILEKWQNWWTCNIVRAYITQIATCFYPLPIAQTVWRILTLNCKDKRWTLSTHTHVTFYETERCLQQIKVKRCMAHYHVQLNLIYSLDPHCCFILYGHYKQWLLDWTLIKHVRTLWGVPFAWICLRCDGKRSPLF